MGIGNRRTFAGLSSLAALACLAVAGCASASHDPGSAPKVGTGTHVTGRSHAGGSHLADTSATHTTAKSIAGSFGCRVTQSGSVTSAAGGASPSQLTYAYCTIQVDGQTVPMEVSTFAGAKAAYDWATGMPNMFGGSTTAWYLVYGKGWVVQIGGGDFRYAADYVQRHLGGTVIKNVQAATTSG